MKCRRTALELWEIEGGPGARWSLKDYENELLSPESQILELCGPDGETLQAFLFFRKLGPDLVEIQQMAARPKNQGHGSQILSELIRWAKRENIKEIQLEVAGQNTAAIRLYQKFGFQLVGTRKNYYKDQDSALLMSLRLS